MNLNNAPALIRFAAVYILIALATSVVIIFTIDSIMGRPIPDQVSNLLWAMATPALAWISAERGVTLTNGDTAQALKTLAAHVNGGSNGQAQPADQP